MDVLPGDYIATTEEYAPSYGVFEEKEKIYADSIGSLQLDAKSHTASLKAKTRIPRIMERGMITLGFVADVTENTAMIDLFPFQQGPFSYIPPGTTAILHVRDVKRGFTQDIPSEIGKGDIIRVKITEVSKHTVSLTTADKDLGVIKAFCGSCRHEVRKIGIDKLKCPNCGRIQMRKLAVTFEKRGNR